jgi:hypothetical protein
MIIKYSTARKLITSKQASFCGTTNGLKAVGGYDATKNSYLVVERYDLQRTDHVLIDHTVPTYLRGGI